jgi:glutathione S-transferase
MRLYFAPASPYSRKVRTAAIELGIANQIEIVLQMPRDNSKGFFDINPLARIPVLETDEGEVLYDSPVICEYLNAQAGGSLFPAKGWQRWHALKRQAVGDGILDSAVPLRQEMLRPAAQQSEEFIARNRATVARALRVLEYAKQGPVDIGSLAIGCALGYLDYRFTDWDWRRDYPALAAWYDTLTARPSFIQTLPI